MGPGTFLKQFFLEGCFSIFVFLQGRKLKRPQITRTKNIFKPKVSTYFQSGSFVYSIAMDRRIGYFISLQNSDI